MASLDITKADPIIKDMYDRQRLTELAFTDRPVFGMLPKNERFVGRKYPLPIRYARPTGGSAVFSTAQSVAGASGFESFDITPVKNYQYATVDGMAIDMGTDGVGSFVDLLETEIDGAVEAAADKLSSMIFRGADGAMGKIASGQGSATITLTDRADIVNFYVGQHVQATANLSTLVDSGDYCTVKAIDRDAGTVTCIDADTAWSTKISGLSTDYLVRRGDLGGAISGFETWVPASAPSTSLFGVDRSIDTLLGGARVDASNMGIEEGLIEGMLRSASYGGKPDLIAVAPDTFGDLLKVIGSKEMGSISPVDMKGKKIAEISYETLRIHSVKGAANVVCDSFCPSNVAWVLETKSWMLLSNGMAPKILNKDGQRIRAVYNDDAYEVRIGFYGNLGCNAPSHNCRVKLA